MKWSFSIVVLTLVAATTASAGPPGIWDPELSRGIDGRIEAVLDAEGLAVAEPAEDAEFVRRVHLDLLGRIPTVEEAEAYLSDSTPDKAHRLIDRLLVHDEMPGYWREVFNDWLIGRAERREEEFLAYLESSLRENRSWKQMSKDLLAPGVDDPRQRGAAHFLGRHGNPKDEPALDGMTKSVASTFFGVQLECAKCHDHPFVEEWKQAHYYGLGAFLRRTRPTTYDKRTALGESADGELVYTAHDNTETTAKMLFLDGHVVEEPEIPVDRQYVVPKGKRPMVPRFSRRQALVDYAIDGENAFFRRAIVNRIWKQLMGRGLVEPVDQMHDQNPASHPELLDWLADDFASHGFDTRRLMAGILYSRAYGRSSRWSPGAPLPEPDRYALAILKPLSPEQLFQSVLVAVDYPETKKGRAAAAKSKSGSTHLLDVHGKGYSLFVERFHANSESFQANVGQAMFMTFNKLPNTYLAKDPASLVARLTNMNDPEAAIRRAYLAVLSRHPEESEFSNAADFLRGAGESDEAYHDFVWALLQSAEFRLNH